MPMRPQVMQRVSTAGVAGVGRQQAASLTMEAEVGSGIGVGADGWRQSSAISTVQANGLDCLIQGLPTTEEKQTVLAKIDDEMWLGKKMLLIVAVMIDSQIHALKICKWRESAVKGDDFAGDGRGELALDGCCGRRRLAASTDLGWAQRRRRDEQLGWSNGVLPVDGYQWREGCRRAGCGGEGRAASASAGDGGRFDGVGWWCQWRRAVALMASSGASPAAAMAAALDGGGGAPYPMLHAPFV
ncbi:hypothetical protein ACLOJK_008762 [Asimina triloba]